MPVENLATWKATTKPPCSPSGPGSHPWSLLVFHRMHTKRKAAPPEATCPLMVWKGRGAERLPMCTVGTGGAAQPLRLAGMGTTLRPLPCNEFAPWEIGRTLLAWPRTSAAWSFPTPPCRRWLESLSWCWGPPAGNPASASLRGGLICTKQV